MRMPVSKDQVQRDPSAVSSQEIRYAPDQGKADAGRLGLTQHDAPASPPAVQRLMELQQAALFSPGVARLQQLQRLDDARATGGHPLQRMKWPTGRKARPPVGEGLWTDEETEQIKELYEWCETDEQFKAVMGAVDFDTWSSLKAVVKKDWKKFCSEVEAPESLAGYFKSKKSSAPSKRQAAYDPSTYNFCSKNVIKIAGDKGLKLDDFEDARLKSFKELIEIEDRLIAELDWKKQAYSDGQQRGEINKEISERERLISEQVDLMVAKKGDLAAAAAKKLARDQGIAAVQAAADKIGKFADVRSNQLALAVWEAAKRHAGSSGYLEVDKTVYEKATVTTATKKLNAFGAEWTDTHGGEGYMTNPHCPGGGAPQDKSTHSNPELRTSIYQANFISKWDGAADTVIHINSKSA